jgi:hypothetical protein
VIPAECFNIAELRGETIEAINGEKVLIEAYLGDEAVTEVYKKIFSLLCGPRI